jgi:Flp pilus assembly protein TadG
MYRNLLQSARRRLQTFRNDISGIALIEFAYSLPLLVGLGMYGTEAAMYVQANMKVSQIALAVADNASRVGDNSDLAVKQIYEGDVNTILSGAGTMSNMNDFYDHSRIVISSVEQNAAGKPYIHWQRCRGDIGYVSPYGVQGTGKLDNALADGIGPANQKAKPIPGSAVIFAEVAMDYKAIFGLAPFSNNRIVHTASMAVRDQRDLSEIYNSTQAEFVSSCS